MERGCPERKGGEGRGGERGGGDAGVCSVRGGLVGFLGFEITNVIGTINDNNTVNHRHVVNYPDKNSVLPFSPTTSVASTA